VKTPEEEVPSIDREHQSKKCSTKHKMQKVDHKEQNISTKCFNKTQEEWEKKLQNNKMQNDLQNMNKTKNANMKAITTLL